MKMPKELEHNVNKNYSTILNEEKLSDYTGDYIILTTMGEESEFTETNNWKNLNAVKKGHIIKLDVTDTAYNDPISLEKQRKIILRQLKNMN